MQHKDALLRSFKFGLGLARAMLTWPKASVTSYTMAAGLASQGVRPRTVIDVGANVGQFAVASAKLFAPVAVHSFEPHPGCFAALKKNLASLPDTHVYPIGVGSTEGTVTFHLNSHTHSSSFLALSGKHRNAFPDAVEIESIQVSVSTLDAVFQGRELVAPVLLKIDVQGYEAEVLKGAVGTLKRVDYVILEGSFEAMYEGEVLFTDLVMHMQGRGFRFLRPVGLLRKPQTGEIVQMDALFQRT